MIALTDEILTTLVFLLLMLTRISAFFILSPIFGRANLPNTLKIMLALIITLILFSFEPVPEQMPYATLIELVLAVLGELAVGLVIGFITTMFFSVVFTAGQIIDTQIGFGMVQVYDVQTNIQVPIAGSLLNMILLICFLAADGHLYLIQLLMRSFELIPVGGAGISMEAAQLIVESFARTFEMAISIAMPVMASGLLAEIALGVVVRAAPQMNVFVVGIPIKIIIGLILLLLMIPPFVSVTGGLFDEMYGVIDRIFEGLRA